MNKHKSVPNIRFKDFDDKWKKEKLGNMVGVIMGQSPSSSNYHNNQVNHSMILIQGNADLENNKIKPRLWTTQITKKTIPNDIILTVRAPVGEVAKNDFNAVLGRGVAALRGNKFLYYYLEKIKQIGYWNRISAGSTFMSISSDDIKEVEINLPTCTEQEYIYNLFTKLDKLLDLQQQKINKLDLLKKALLQKLFPKHDAKIPELRYREFEDNWIIYSFSGLLIKNSSKNKNLEVENIESISNKNGFTKQSEQFDGYRVASLDLSNYYVIKGNQFAYNPSRINVGSIAYKRTGEEDSIISPLYVSFSTKNNINDTFLWYWFRTSSFKKQRIQFSEGGVRDTLPFENLKKMRIKLPRLNEQQKIGNLLSKVDQLIELENKKLHNLQQVKKCLLQNMFVE